MPKEDMADVLARWREVREVLYPLEAARRGEMSLVVDEVLPLEQAVLAHQKMDAGKVLVGSYSYRLEQDLTRSLEAFLVTEAQRPHVSQVVSGFP